jgi:hypothetical protein
MKRLCILFSISIIVFNINAQIGIKVGLGISSERVTSVDIPVADPGLYFHWGFFYEYQINNKYFIQPELLSTHQVWGIDYKSNTSEYKSQGGEIESLRTSILFGTKRQIFNNQNFIVAFVGPYMGIGIEGNYTFDKNVPGPNHNQSFYSGAIKFGNNKMTNYLRRIDFGLRLGIGYEFNKNQFALSYHLGLRDLSPSTYQKRYSQVLALSYSYRFGPKNNQ